MIKIVNSGKSLYNYLVENGLNIDHVSAIDTSNNCIYLPDKTTFNWKQSMEVVRVNCKEDAKRVIEQATGEKMMNNGVGDKTRPFSLLIDSEEILLMVINVLRCIDGNGIEEDRK